MSPVLKGAWGLKRRHTSVASALLRRMTDFTSGEDSRLRVLQGNLDPALSQRTATIPVILLSGAGNVYSPGLLLLLSGYLVLAGDGDGNEGKKRNTKR